MPDSLPLRPTLARLSTDTPDFEARFAALLEHTPESDPAVTGRVATILEDVRTRGDAALVEYTQRFDGHALPLEIAKAEMRAAWDSLPQDLRAALENAHARLRAYAEHQRVPEFSYTDADGNTLGQRVTALDRAGLYAPGGKAAYPSSVLMNAIPARVAGVAETILCAPAPQGLLNPVVLGAAHLCGVDRMFRLGGAQAIAALAYGTESVPAVDKIVGPGNAYVAAAKRAVFGRVGIDSIAGPSEILVIADGTLSPDWMAMDLFSQAEHDEVAQAILLSPDAAYLDAVHEAMARRLGALPRADIVRASLAGRGALVKVANLEEACDLANRVAAEHLELAVADPDAWLPRIRHAGAIFLGAHAPEAFGDYCAGPNHVLPTARAARFSGPLGTHEFQKRTSLIRCTPAGARRLAPIAARLADAEGLGAHAASARDRL